MPSTQELQEAVAEFEGLADVSVEEAAIPEAPVDAGAIAATATPTNA